MLPVTEVLAEKKRFYGRKANLKNRSLLEISMEVLKYCVVPRRPCHITETLKINFPTFYRVVGFLSSRGLLSVQVVPHRIRARSSSRPNHALSSNPRMYERKLYCAMEKGKEVLKVWDDFQKKLAWKRSLS